METNTRVESLLSKIAKWYRQSSLGKERQYWPGNVVEYLEDKLDVSPEDMVSLQCVTISGSFGGYNVSIIRIFDRIEAARRELTVRSYHDLDEYPELIVFEGYVFKNGPVHLYKKKLIAATSVS
ncbi:MAG: hypothetical protein JSV77_00915 [Dehalococcoidales bacterium]|nr:MAG: hypothetical protein JSV77_00915 [Dehalococcoidales bacterium]